MATETLAQGAKERNPEELLADSLDVFEAGIEQTAREFEEHEGSYSAGHVPETLRPLDDEALKLLAHAGDDPAVAERYINLYERYTALRELITGERVDAAASLVHLERIFSPEAVREVLNTEQHGFVRGLISESIKTSLSKGESFGKVLTFVRYMYGVSRPSELLAPSSDPVRSEIRSLLMSTGGARTLYNLEVGPAKPEDTDEDRREAHREWMRDVILKATHISDPEMADGYVYAASRQTIGSFENVFDIVQRIEALGPDKLKAIREFSGTYALADYSDEQLDQLYRLSQGDKAEIARLKNHDVTVVFINRMGDYNGSLSSIPEAVGDSRLRTICFEIQSPHDISRACEKLLAMGIQPSRIVFAEHGGKGSQGIASKPAVGVRDAFSHEVRIDTPRHTRLSTERLGDKERFRALSVRTLRSSLGRLVDRFMQPSRNIDDAPESHGAKEIVFIACSAAEETPARHAVANGDAVQVTEGDSASVAGQLAKELLSGRVQSRVVVYAADTVIGPEETTPTGFTYTIPGYMGGGHTPAVRIEVDGGLLTTTKVSQIQLRNFDQPRA